jgi:hypothetical protein
MVDDPDDGAREDRGDPEEVQQNARRRRHERTERIEETAALAEHMFGEHKYPVASEELAVEYADESVDLPNETEATMGDVFDRLVDERFESAEGLREAVTNQITGAAGGPEEYNDERALQQLDEAAGKAPVDGHEVEVTDVSNAGKRVERDADQPAGEEPGDGATDGPVDAELTPGEDLKTTGQRAADVNRSEPARADEAVPGGTDPDRSGDVAPRERAQDALDPSVGEAGGTDPDGEDVPADAETEGTATGDRSTVRDDEPVPGETGQEHVEGVDEALEDLAEEDEENRE